MVQQNKGKINSTGQKQNKTRHVVTIYKTLKKLQKKKKKKIIYKLSEDQGGITVQSIRTSISHNEGITVQLGDQFPIIEGLRC